MDWLLQLSVVIICAFCVWRIFKVLKANPDLLSRDKVSKSFTTMGFLALLLIGMVFILVQLVK